MKTLKFTGLIVCTVISFTSCRGLDAIDSTENYANSTHGSTLSRQSEFAYSQTNDLQDYPSIVSLASDNSPEKIKINLAGRILVDAGVFDSKNKGFANGMALPDHRLGAKAYYGDYYGKIDIGFANGRINLKDVFIERKVSPSSSFRAGYYIPTFGLQSTASSSQKVAFEELISNEIFSTNRSIGFSYGYNKNSLFGAATAFVENQSMYESSNVTEKQAFGMSGRFVYRSTDRYGILFHVGLSGAYEKPRWNKDASKSHKSFVSNINFPSRIARVSAIGAEVTEAKNMVKFAPEILFASGPIGIETQYTQANITREKGHINYMANGVHATLRGLIVGGDYKYASFNSGLATPRPGSLECVLSYGYADMSHKKSSILGGEMNDIGLTFSYYINKYMMWRFRYSHTETKNRSGFDNQKFNAFQTRIQIIF